MPRNTGNNGSGKALSRAERLAQALELRKAGLTFEVIARECGYKNAQRAHEAVTRAIRDIPRQPAEDVRAVELERLDSMFAGLWTRATGGDNRAVLAALKVMGRRAKLLGLDATAAAPPPEPEPMEPAAADRIVTAFLRTGTPDAPPTERTTPDAP